MIAVLRIYADFNACLDFGDAEAPGFVHLNRMGTLRDLCAAQLRLCEGMRLLLFSDSSMDEDIEVDAIVRWHSNPEAPSGGYWVGEFKPQAFRDVPLQRHPSLATWFPCGSCGENLAAEIQQKGLNAESRCANCDHRVHTPIEPPDESTRMLTLIEEAFSGVVLGDGVSLRETLVLDNYGGADERRRAREQDVTADWHALLSDPELVRLAYVGGFPFFDAAGMRFHLPAYLTLAVAFERNDTQNVLECLMFTLTNQGAANTPRFASLDATQRRCIAEVLRFLRKTNELSSGELDEAIEWWFSSMPG
jgi:hypothetical protein